MTRAGAQRLGEGAAHAVPETGKAPRGGSGAGSVAAVAALGGAAFCFVTGETLPVGLLPQLAAGLRTSVSTTGALVTVYALVVVAVSAPLTRLTRRLPRRSLMGGLAAIFVLGTLAAAGSPGYPWLVAARVVTALAQAVFWSIVAVVAAGMVPPSRRGRAVAGVFVGSSMALILGVPAATWIGQQAGWRLAFAALSGLGAIDVAALSLLLPATALHEEAAARGSQPDRRRYGLTIAATILCVAGSFTAYTYVTEYLTRVSGLPLRAIAPVLLLVGVADAIGVAVTGLLIDRRPRLTRVGAVAVLSAALLVLFAAGGSGAAAVVLQTFAGVGLSGAALSFQSHVLVVAPRRTDIASAWYSASFNIGIATGPLVGGAVLSTAGLRWLPLAGGALALLGLVAIVLESTGGSGAPLT